MTRVLRSAVKKNPIKENLKNELSISKKSKAIKRTTKKKVLAKGKECQQNDIWSIDSIISNIFAYTEFKDLVKLNTVCKRWNNLTNPIIHKTIKLQRRRAFQNKDHKKNLLKSAKTDAEVEMCIANNSKHAQYIKEFKFTEKLNPQRVIQLFKTFRFITNLTIEGVSMSQDQFITMIAPLTQLKQLNLKRLNIRRIIKNRYITEPAVLPLALNKLALDRIHLDNDAELFLQTINSHKNLVEFKFDDYNTESFLDPFFNNYPTLKAFEFKNYQVDYTQSLIMIFESNPQLISLKLELYNFNCSLISDINLNLINLQEFIFIEPNSYSQISSPIISKFSRPTKIKKLKICCDKLSECSINSILINCPDLEELGLNPADYYQSNTSKISFSLPNSVKIKKLNISGDRYNQASLNSVLMKCSQLKELEIKLPQEWKECIKIIGLACANLEHLKIWPSGNIGGPSLDETFQELHEIEFLSSNPLYKSTLTHLTLYEYNIYDSKAEYFNNFPKLKCLEYMSQNRGKLSISDIKTNFNKDLWPNYRLDTKIEKYRWEAKLVKLNI